MLPKDMNDVKLSSSYRENQIDDFTKQNDYQID